MPDNNKISIKVHNGELVAYVDPETKQAGIMFRTLSDDTVDLACVSLENNKGEPYYHKQHASDKDMKDYNKLHLFVYGDAFDEDYTHDTHVDIRDIYTAFEGTTVDAPDSSLC